ncbi:Methyltransferase type 11 [Leptothrix cholodnii SP-6]|uniref:Methyltransferase type 11 n=1 Tax=Leptothrix cholodnii (strain ATCC 51168 / LMG 8142 / SP-6) TaxID=395495 RepID=B1Y3U1_LEPCP|nr:class I SAM-dependent methyltransferase [Leptothrix cholodnii]ACB33335.1 Methyltransferase type 11 [Leptothrix cholodnii SP-6]
MSVWSEGYVADIDYTASYFGELNPLRAQLAFLNAGLAFPAVRNAFEMAFGHGISVNIHAAASPTRWFGNDFAPAQAAYAQELAQAAGSNAQLTEESFAELLERPDLPAFDFIALHGIWSWVSDTNRTLIVDFIRRKLAPGGVVYVSYNTLPGWAHIAPMRQLIKEHAHTMRSPGEGTVKRVQGALEFAEQFLGLPSQYKRATPQAAEWLAELKTKDPVYVAHEYFNDHWKPMYFSDVVRDLAPAKLSFACSATLLEQVYPLNLNAEQMAMLAGIGDAHYRESMLDFIVNQQFRRDYWVKGARRLSAIEQLEAMRRLRLVLLTPAERVPLKVSGRLGTAALSEAIYRPLLAALADHKPKSIGAIEAALAPQGVDLPKIIQAVVVLTHENHLAPAQDDSSITASRKTSDRLNAHLLQLARSNRPITCLASAVTGGGVRVPWHIQLFLLARSKGLKQPAEWAQFASEQWTALGHQMVKDGKTIESAQATLAELKAMAAGFSEHGIAPLKALQIV